MTSRMPVVLDPGKLPHCPTPESREFVMQLVSMGLEEPQIAFCLKITPLDLKKHYADELVFGLSLVNAKVGAALLANCLRGDTNAQKFWLQTRGRWVVADKEDPKQREGSARALEDRQRVIDDIVGMVAKHRATEDKAAVTQRANPGTRR